MSNFCKSLVMVKSTVIGALLILLSPIAFSAEESPKKEGSNNASKTQTLVIQSQVKGSQEQPNVIYIMPWQGVDKVIEVKGKERTINLPHFKPINPRAFKEQVRFFSNKKISSNANNNNQALIATEKE